MEHKYSEKELNSISKAELVELCMLLQDSVSKSEKALADMSRQVSDMTNSVEKLTEQLALMNQRMYGRSSEKLSNIKYDGQLTLADLYDSAFNEAEALTSTLYVPEPDFEKVVVKEHTRKQKGKRESDLEGFPVEVINHELPEEKLHEIFGDSWKTLPDEVYKRLRYQPASYTVEEHHVFVYAGKDNETIVRADRPADLLRNSIVTPSLEAAVLNGKYVNALPLYRIEQEFKRNDVNIARQVMANWTIQCSERYLSLLYDRLHEELFKYDVLQADETTVEVSKDGRPANSKSYMWVYRNSKFYKDTPIILYDYQRTRKADHPREFLKGFSGYILTDGYSAYEKLDREEETLKFAGCWAHARRRFAEACKVCKDPSSLKGTIAAEALERIAEIYKRENEYSQLSPDERLRKRKVHLKPVVEAFFEWTEKVKAENLLPPSSKTLDGIDYCINQKKYLKLFLKNGNIPLDNNATEGAIRGFCVGRNNWKLIDTIDGAKASAIAYSIAETAKANHLNPYRYYEHLLTEIPKHMNDKDTSFLDSLLPWSDQLPEVCRQIKQ